MKKFDKKNKEKTFLEQQYSKDITERHSNYLGIEIPEGYFAASKLSILRKIKSEKPDESEIIHE